MSDSAAATLCEGLDNNKCDGPHESVANDENQISFKRKYYIGTVEVENYVQNLLVFTSYCAN